MKYRGFEIMRTSSGLYYAKGSKRYFPTEEGVKAFIRLKTEKMQTRDRRRGYRKSVGTKHKRK